MALKLDVSKAYDIIEWGFLKEVMLNLVFSSQWVHIMLKMCFIIFFSLLINGEVSSNIIPQSGLR